MFAFQIRRRARAAAIASGLALARGSAAILAQPGPGAGPGFGAGAGPIGPRGGDPVGRVIEQYKTQLALNTSQQQMMDNAVAVAQQARQGARAQMQQVHAAMQAELAKAAPDLAAVAAVADSAQANASTLRKQARDAWLTLYATFTPEQKAVVRDALLARMQRAQQMQQQFQQRLQQRSGAAG